MTQKERINPHPRRHPRNPLGVQQQPTQEQMEQYAARIVANMIRRGNPRDLRQLQRDFAINPEMAVRILRRVARDAPGGRGMN